jgi:hypothetical protein
MSAANIGIIPCTKGNLHYRPHYNDVTRSRSLIRVEVLYTKESITFNIDLHIEGYFKFFE